MKRFESKVVIVTGATTGIGYVTAKRFAAQGANVVCMERNPERGATLINQLTSGKSLFIPTVRNLKNSFAGWVIELLPVETRRENSSSNGS